MAQRNYSSHLKHMLIKFCTVHTAHQDRESVSIRSIDNIAVSHLHNVLLFCFPHLCQRFVRHCKEEIVHWSQSSLLLGCMHLNAAVRWRTKASKTYDVFGEAY